MQNSGPKPQSLLWVFGLALLVWVFVYQLEGLAPRWEEPRRALVAYEMVHRTNFIVPTVFSETYTKKPPLQAWLVAAMAGFDTARVTVTLVRLLSVLSIFATATLLFLVARSQRLRWPMTAPVVYLTFGIVTQYGRSGAIDPLFSLWTSLALFCFYLGHVRKQPGLALIVSQLFVALGVLTKGLAPLFVYPPVALFLWRAEKGSAPWRPMMFGFALCVAVISAWLVPFLVLQPSTQLGATGVDEVLMRTPFAHGFRALLLNLVTWPFVMLGNLLPWSAALLAAVHPAVRRFAKDMWQSAPLFRFCIFVLGWMFIALWFLPGARGRYALPAYPCAALIVGLVADRMHAPRNERARRITQAGWLLLAIVFVAAVFQGASKHPDIDWRVPAVAAITAVGVCFASVRISRVPLFVPTFALIGFLYAAFFVCVHGPSRNPPRHQEVLDWRTMAKEIRTDALARGLDPDRIPVGCAPGTHQRVCYEFTRVLGRPLQRPWQYSGPSYAVGHRTQSPMPEDRLSLANAHGFELYYRHYSADQSD